MSEIARRTRTKVGFSIAQNTVDDLNALAFALKKSKSEVVDEALQLCIARLTTPQRAAFLAARAVTRAP